MKSIALTKGRVAIVDDEDYEWLKEWKWHANGSGNKPQYAARRVFVGDGSRRSKVILMHHFIMPRIDGLYVDHANGNSLDNRRSNLRYCTMTENNHNLPAHRDGGSQYKGVCWSENKKRWRANICLNSKQTHLGYFDSEALAAAAYDEAAKRHYGKFARLNLAQERHDDHITR